MISAFIKTYGCQANVADSSNLAKYLQGLGCAIVDHEAQADLIIINSCAIREKAEHRMFSYIGSLVPHKKQKPYLAVGVIGCVASYRKKEIFLRAPHVSFVFSAREDLSSFKDSLSDTIETIATQKKLYGDELTKNSQAIETPIRSMVNIMRGCDNYCSYCIVPFTTGRERSFSIDSILEQVAKDVDAGAKEVILIGQNVNSYKDPETGAPFATLLQRVAELPGEFWVRFISPHPKDMTPDVIDAMARYDKLCAFIHLPLQSGSNSVLQAMNRTYTAEKYLEQVAMIRERLPHVLFSTDIIVGFPGETEEDYMATREIVDRVRFHTVYSFIYSPRKYTKAAQLEDNCPPSVKQQRLMALQKRQREIGTATNEAFVGKTFRVLFEGETWGRTEGNVKVFVPEAMPIGSFADVLIEEGRWTELRGKVVR